jgi:protein CMS1
MRTWPTSFGKVCQQATISVKISHLSFPVAPTLATRISQASKNNGAPTCIMLAGNANRVTDLTRAFRPLKGEKGGEVCKVSSYFVVAGIASISDDAILFVQLFARHFKLAEHAEHLKKTKVGVAVGTPGRVSALLNDTGVCAIFAAQVPS